MKNSMERLTNVGTNGEIWISDNDETRKIGQKGAVYKKLKAYEDADEQGLLLRLPCKVGSTVYRIEELWDCKYGYDCPFEDAYDINKCEDDERMCENECVKNIINERKFDISMLDEVGKTVFLAKSEAETELKEMEELVEQWKKRGLIKI